MPTDTKSMENIVEPNLQEMKAMDLIAKGKSGLG